MITIINKPMPAHHPYAYTLSLLRLSLKKLPPTFPEDRKQFYEEKLNEYEDNPDTAYDEITNTIVRFGKESWPWRQAYDDLYKTYGRSSEEAHLLNRLDEGLRQKYELFIHEGGKIDHLSAPRSEQDLYRSSPFERYFTPEEKFAIQQALLAAKEEARKEIDQLATKAKADDYGQAVDDWLKRQVAINNKVEELRRLADVSPRWRPELTDRVRLIEEGWSVVEKGIDEPTLDKELEYWKGTLESFLH